MTSLQDRLDKAFGALVPSTDPSPSWRPTTEQVFKVGGALDGGNSTDEEHEEKERREALPGLAQELADEDVPDEEGFRPSTAFCRQLDAEEEYNDIDEVATGMMARWAGGEALPPRCTQVLDDNVYEQRAQQHAAAEPAQGAGAGQPRSALMDVDGPPAQQPAAAAAPSAAGGSSSADRPQERRRVRFEGAAEQHDPSARARVAVAPPRQRGSGRSRVPHHVQHPDKYTCYVLDEPLVVGGGVAQLAAGSQRNQREAPPRAAAGQEKEEEEEEARWQGPPGSVQFVSRQQRAGGAALPGGAAASPAGAPAVARSAAAQQPAIACMEEEQNAGMEEDPLLSPAPATGKRQRQYRRAGRAAEDAP